MIAWCWELYSLWKAYFLQYVQIVHWKHWEYMEYMEIWGSGMSQTYQSMSIGFQSSSEMENAWEKYLCVSWR